MKKRKLLILIALLMTFAIVQLTSANETYACDDSKQFAHPEIPRTVCSVATSGEPLYDPSVPICIVTGQGCKVTD